MVQIMAERRKVIIQCDAGVLLIGHMGPFLLAWINFNPSMDTYLHTQWKVGWNNLSNPKLQRLHRWSVGMDN